MYNGLVSMLMAGSLVALQPVRVPKDDINIPVSISKPSSSISVLTTYSDTLTIAFRNFSWRDYQVNGVLPIRLWAVKEMNGVYANMMYEVPSLVIDQRWNFFDFNTQTWVADTDGWAAPWPGYYGNMAVNYYANSYQYFPFISAHRDDANYRSDAFWPEPPFDPISFSGNYINAQSETVENLWPYVGLTANGALHQIFTDYEVDSGAIFEIMYNRIPDPENPLWDGEIMLVPTDDGPWYGFYPDPFSNTLVITYCRNSSDNHIIMLIDTMAGDMFYAGSPIIVDVSQEIYNAGYTQYYIGFVGDGNPFVDKARNIHLITFAWDGQNITPTHIYHFFFNPRTGEKIVSFIKSLTDFYYPVGINTLIAGRSQIGQGEYSGNLYAIWEEFIQEPGRFVVSSTNDTLAPTRIVFALSTDNGATWQEEVLLESDQIGDNNNWLRFPCISPVIPRIGSVESAYWGVYFDDEPGFSWNSGPPLLIEMLVGRKEFIGVEEKLLFPKDLIKINYKIKGKEVIFNFEIPSKSFVTMKIVDILGRNINTLYSGNLEGKYSLAWNVYKVPSGIYFLYMKIRKEVISQKILIFTKN